MTYSGLVKTIGFVIVVGSLGAFVGRWIWVVPASSFGTTGQWVSGIAAVAAIQAVRIDAKKRMDEIHKRGGENLVAAANLASEHLADWHTAHGTVRERQPIVSSLLVLARLADSACLRDAALYVPTIDSTMQLPAAYVYGSQKLLQEFRTDLQAAVVALGDGKSISEEVEGRLCSFVEQFPIYNKKLDEAKEVGTHLAAMEKATTSLASHQDKEDFAKAYDTRFPVESAAAVAAIESSLGYYQTRKAWGSAENRNVNDSLRAIEKAIKEESPSST